MSIKRINQLTYVDSIILNLYLCRVILNFDLVCTIGDEVGRGRVGEGK